MKREHLLVGLVLLLVLINAIVLYKFTTTGNRPFGGPPPHDRIIVRTLNLDDKQQRAFEDMKFRHRTAINELDKQFETTLEAYFLLLPDSDRPTKDSLENVIGNIEQQKAQVTFDHFNELRNLCRDDQKKAFDEFIPQLFRFIMPPAPKNLPPPRRNGEKVSSKQQSLLNQ